MLRTASFLSHHIHYGHLFMGTLRCGFISYSTSSFISYPLNGLRFRLKADNDHLLEQLKAKEQD